VQTGEGGEMEIIDSIMSVDYTHFIYIFYLTIQHHVETVYKTAGIDK